MICTGDLQTPLENRSINPFDFLRVPSVCAAFHLFRSSHFIAELGKEEELSLFFAEDASFLEFLFAKS